MLETLLLKKIICVSGIVEVTHSMWATDFQII